MKQQGRNPAKGKYCDKHHRWVINVAGKLRCPDCFRARVERKREKMATEVAKEMA